MTMEQAPAVDIEKLAELARLHLTEEEKAVFSAQVADILGYFRQLQAVDVTGIAPMAHPFDAEAPLRDDKPGAPWPPARALRNAPAVRDKQIGVPKVVEEA